MNKDTNQIMALINAYRMDGLGNNFLIIDRRKDSLEINKDKIVNLANKNVVPFDQLITLEKEEENICPIKIFNPDGIEVTACGNGVRCIAYLIFQEKKQKKILIKTKERVLNAEVIGKQYIKINMGKPKFIWREVPLSKNMDTKQISIDLLGKEHGYGFCLSIGNPHIVFFVKDCFKIDIKKLGPKIENYKLFPERTNVTFAQILDKKNIKINMGKPKFNWEEVPLNENIDTKQISVDVLEKEFGHGFCLNVGNPHIIFFVKDSFKIDIKKLGPKIENYKLFPERINVTFAQILDKKNIKVNVCERGAGQTKACGTAACATAVAASKKGLTDKNLNIHFKEGSLQIDYEEEIFMTGSVSKVKKINLDI